MLEVTVPVVVGMVELDRGCGRCWQWQLEEAKLR
jgi:hypothetical protein